MKILVIEDEPRTANSIKQALEEHNFAVDMAFDGQIGQKLALREEYDLIISDIILPYMNGLELCKSIREHGIETPVLMLTALGTADDKVSGLDSGADDYLVKPFEFKELLARVRALLRRSVASTSHTNILRFADIEMNLESKEVSRSGKKIELTPKEFALMEYLIRNHGKVVSKAEIAEKVWEINFDTGTNVIEVYVNYLRKKIDRDFPHKLIHTQFGMGYILREE